MVDGTRLKQAHELAARTKELERALPDLAELRSGNRALSFRLRQLRLMELQAWTMTPTELAEQAALEAEMQKDRDDYRNGDWTK